MLIIASISHAQVGIATTTPDPSSVLDIVANDAGVLIPRVSLTGTTDVTTISNGNVESLLVYNTQTISDVTPGYYYWYNNKWQRMITDNNDFWKLNGNSNVDALQNYVGTNDDNDLVFKRNNVFSGRLQPTSTFFGVNSNHLNTIGDRTSVFGSEALTNNTSGLLNNAFGFSSLHHNTTGHNNSAFGTYALHYNVSGNSNCSFGDASLMQNTSGYNNNAFGNYSLSRSTVGSLNVAFGTSSLTFNTTGSRNVAIGNSALQNNTTGVNNTALGHQSLRTNTVSNNNTAIGYFSLLRNSIGNNNSALGFESLYNTNSDNNTAFGYEAGKSNFTGSNNVFIGFQADATTSNLVNAIAIGYNSKVDSSNSLVLGGTGVDAVNVGIGTSQPVAKIHIISSFSELTPAIIEGCNVYSDNAAAIAAGLPEGAIYRTSTGVLMIRY